jgi:hypothetical protein
MNLITEFTPADFASSHPELHHYTNFDGLAGIHKSCEQPLVEALTKRFGLLLQERQRKHAYVQRAIEETGGGVAGIAAGQAQKMVRSFYDTMLRSAAPLDLYVTSFCTHADDPYAREHGLLSQWRGYGGGGDGGYCIVFETAGLVDLLRREFAAHYWVMALRIDQVHYYSDNFSVEGIFAPLLSESDKLLSALMDHTEIPEAVMAFFFWAAPLLKHQGFREEHEARIVAIPAPQHDLNGVRSEHGDIFIPPFKTIHTRDGGRGRRQYLALFESFRPELPADSTIQRIIE